MVPLSVPEPVDSNSVAPAAAPAPPAPPPPARSAGPDLSFPVELLELFFVTFVGGGMSLVLSSLLPQPNVRMPKAGIRNIAAANRTRFIFDLPKVKTGTVAFGI